jgi:hypothetical protein
MIKNLTRDCVVFEFEGKTAAIQGEAYLRGYGSPDFVIYEKSITHWDPPHQWTVIDEQTVKTAILCASGCFRTKRDDCRRGVTIRSLDDRAPAHPARGVRAGAQL